MLPRSLFLAIFALAVAAASALVLVGARYFQPLPGAEVHVLTNYVDGKAVVAGSGVMIAPMLMLTAAHVVEGAKGGVWLAGASKAPVRVLRVDSKRDLALVQVALTCPCASLGRAPGVGDEVVGVGFPLSVAIGSVKIVTEGRVQGTHEGQLVYTAPVAGGNSGGGVFVHDGLFWRLVGIASQVAGEYIQIGPWNVITVPVPHIVFAVTVDDIRAFLTTSAPAELDAVKSAPLPARDASSVPPNEWDKLFRDLAELQRLIEEIDRLLTERGY